jgi:hypothetical protein
MFLFPWSKSVWKKQIEDDSTPLDRRRKAAYNLSLVNEKEGIEKLSSLTYQGDDDAARALAQAYRKTNNATALEKLQSSAMYPCVSFRGFGFESADAYEKMKSYTLRTSRVAANELVSLYKDGVWTPENKRHLIAALVFAGEYAQAADLDETEFVQYAQYTVYCLIEDSGHLSYNLTPGNMGVKHVEGAIYGQINTDPIKVLGRLSAPTNYSISFLRSLLRERTYWQFPEEERLKEAVMLSAILDALEKIALTLASRRDQILARELSHQTPKSPRSVIEWIVKELGELEKSPDINTTRAVQAWTRYGEWCRSIEPTEELPKVHVVDQSPPNSSQPVNDPLDKVIGELIGIGRKSAPDSRSASNFLTSGEEKARQIGEQLNRVGGLQLMLKAHAAVAVKLGVVAARELESAWDGIGEWGG